MTDWLKKANQVLGDLAGQAGRQAETLQLQAKLGSLENDLEQVYVEAGKRAEELMRERRVQDDELRVILERAREINERMMEVRRQVQDLRQTPERATEPEAPTAGSEPQPQPAPEPQPRPQPQPAEPAEESAVHRTCSSCGERVKTHAVFCAQCGTKLGGSGE
ncbi:MAG: zinc-ribbon domain-containing protein [Armatimonadota bacterium]|jgi:hypothetical protein